MPTWTRYFFSVSFDPPFFHSVELITCFSATLFITSFCLARFLIFIVGQSGFLGGPAGHLGSPSCENVKRENFETPFCQLIVWTNTLIVDWRVWKKSRATTMCARIIFTTETGKLNLGKHLKSSFYFRSLRNRNFQMNLRCFVLFWTPNFAVVREILQRFRTP